MATENLYWFASTNLSHGGPTRRALPDGTGSCRYERVLMLQTRSILHDVSCLMEYTADDECRLPTRP